MCDIKNCVTRLMWPEIFEGKLSLVKKCSFFFFFWWSLRQTMFTNQKWTYYKIGIFFIQTGTKAFNMSIFSNNGWWHKVPLEMTAEKQNVQCFTQLYKTAKLQESPFRPVEHSLIKTSYCIAVIMQNSGWHRSPVGTCRGKC